MIRKYALFKVFEAMRNSSNEESVRSLAQKAKVGVATSKRCLDYMLEKDIVKRKILGKLYQYSFNEENLLTRQLKISMKVAELSGSGLIKELIEKYKEITSIVLFGSSATGTYKPDSDIDILIISRKKIKLKPLQSEKGINNEMSFIIYTHEEWRNKAETDKAFYDSIVIDGIALYGELPVVK